MSNFVVRNELSEQNLRSTLGKQSISIGQFDYGTHIFPSWIECVNLKFYFLNNIVKFLFFPLQKFLLENFLRSKLHSRHFSCTELGRTEYLNDGFFWNTISDRLVAQSLVEQKSQQSAIGFISQLLRLFPWFARRDHLGGIARVQRNPLTQQDRSVSVEFVPLKRLLDFVMVFWKYSYTISCKTRRERLCSTEFEKWWHIFPIFLAKSKTTHCRYR